ncbi:MAG: winged helix-turn-helix transcriptional regulator [Clostridiales bacterium]|nr:winged helix-turn-helix transcriptional regulator [Clostridiales bacterium]
MASLYGKHAKVFKALCDEKRLKILELLQNGEKCACVLMDDMTMPQSSLSYHMKVLCDSGIVSGRMDGKWTYYSISEAGSLDAIELLKELTQINAAVESAAC